MIGQLSKLSRSALNSIICLAVITVYCLPSSRVRQINCDNCPNLTIVEIENCQVIINWVVVYVIQMLLVRNGIWKLRVIFSIH